MSAITVTIMVHSILIMIVIIMIMVMIILTVLMIMVVVIVTRVHLREVHRLRGLVIYGHPCCIRIFLHLKRDIDKMRA